MNYKEQQNLLAMVNNIKELAYQENEHATQHELEMLMVALEGWPVE